MQFRHGQKPQRDLETHPAYPENMERTTESCQARFRSAFGVNIDARGMLTFGENGPSLPNTGIGAYGVPEDDTTHGEAEVPFASA